MSNKTVGLLLITWGAALQAATPCDGVPRSNSGVTMTCVVHLDTGGRTNVTVKPSTPETSSMTVVVGMGPTDTAVKMKPITYTYTVRTPQGRAVVIGVSMPDAMEVVWVDVTENKAMNSAAFSQ